MFTWGLKTRITLNLAFLLFFGMLMLDWVFVTLARQALLEREMESCSQILATLDAALAGHLEETGYFEENGAPDPGVTGPGPATQFTPIPERILAASNVSALVIQPPAADLVWVGVPAGARTRLAAAARQARRYGEPQVTYADEGRGLFFKSPGHMVYSAAIDHGARGVWGAALEVDLGSLNADLQRIQKFLLIYILINGILLTLFGLHRLGRLTIKPLTNLVKRAETYQDEGRGFFLPVPRNNEFNILSDALNRMLLRIGTDREALSASVTSLEQANRELRKARNDVIRAEKLASVGRLSAGIAHEIGNPIGIVLGYLELLKQPDLSAAEREDCVARAVTEIGRIDAIIRQLLDFARPAQVEPVPLAIHDVLGEVAEVFQLQPLTAKIPLKLDLQARHDRIRGDDAQLRQVFLNLMLNARDAISARNDGEEGELTIVTRNHLRGDTGAKPPAGTISIDFIDNGIGIDPAQKENIFDPFFTTKAPGQGTGLGLAVSFTIIRNFGGTLEAHGRKAAAGTRMTVTLPLHPESEIEPQTGTTA